jgi:hypothetical protein
MARLLTQANLDIKGNILSQLPLELAVTEAILKPDAAQPKPAKAEPTPPKPAVRPPVQTEPAKAVTARAQESAQPSPPKEREPEPLPVVEPAPVAVPGTGIVDLATVRSRWGDIIEALRNYNPRSQALSAQAVLRSGVPIDVKGDTIVLGFPSEFHKNRIIEATAKSLVEKAIADTLGLPACAIRGVIATQQELKTATAASAKRPSAQPVNALRDPLVDYMVNEHNAVVKEIASEGEPASQEDSL